MLFASFVCSFSVTSIDHGPFAASGTFTSYSLLNATKPFGSAGTEPRGVAVIPSAPEVVEDRPMSRTGDHGSTSAITTSASTPTIATMRTSPRSLA